MANKSVHSGIYMSTAFGRQLFVEARAQFVETSILNRLMRCAVNVNNSNDTNKKLD
jgi:hypothetical protein